jgi:hypothetical protein
VPRYQHFCSGGVLTAPMTQIGVAQVGQNLEMSVSDTCVPGFRPRLVLLESDHFMVHCTCAKAVFREGILKSLFNPNTARGSKSSRRAFL